MTTEQRTGSWSEIEACAQAAGLGELEHRRRGSIQGGGGALVGCGGAIVLVGAALVVLALAGQHADIAKWGGVLGAFVSYLLFSRRLFGSVTRERYIVVAVIAVVLIAPSAYVLTKDEDGSWLSLTYVLLLSALVIAAGVYLAREGRRGPSAVRRVESTSIYEHGVVYAGPSLRDWEPVAFPWRECTIEESLENAAVGPSGTVVRHAFTIRRNDGVWITLVYGTGGKEGQVVAKLQQLIAEREAHPGA